MQKLLASSRKFASPLCHWQLVDLSAVENVRKKLLWSIAVATKMRRHRLSNVYGRRRSVVVSALASINMFECEEDNGVSVVCEQWTIKEGSVT